MEGAKMGKEQHHHSTTLLDRSKATKKQPYRKPDAVKYLESLIFEDKKLRYPTIPVEYLAVSKYRDDSANSLTKCIIDFLRIKGHQAERISTTGRAIDRQTTFTDVAGRVRTIGRIEWIPGTTTKGSADISATIKGRSVKIEVKIGADRMSHYQQKYQQDVEAAGGVFFIARNFSSFVTWYNLNFEP
jgi:hypothetical protein